MRRWWFERSLEESAPSGRRTRDGEELASWSEQWLAKSKPLSWSAGRTRCGGGSSERWSKKTAP